MMLSYIKIIKKEEDYKIKIISKKIIQFDELLMNHIKKKRTLLKKDKYDAQETGYNRKIDSLKLSRDDQQEIFNKMQSESFQVQQK